MSNGYQVMKHSAKTGENDALEAQHKTDFLNLRVKVLRKTARA
ncbi:hypothetical protein FP742_23545 [Vibrio parahaemolyticus]|uniref:Uncharacterized protein n=1 Tax=Vibrio parahaemolyticus serotype O3:K6 (strain RIMD 2210633) TaxID=223926 RepID=Q87MU0_VIBPA|nr:hypothetical protein A6J30_25325 [Vibrio parahaemolyticus]BAC60404.1 hypothetical protein [Vibrio parahaemolyticus RIMD 2210633]AZV70377.1 hypothetical protein D0853_05185 [Vibrio parahaemolyticus]EGQ9366895.1 hypothetical protein [Vibrio parahaemolyticus]EGQ9368825.1 hypothetical protein [Vibrio parahaemolyticus]